ncbi:MAG: hypothetical protein M1829_005977 [Trizodia sp. TS-e1964]|nr:MAG: hypothetical protein M1829_005977 [Trizodia sp. TS-e1964]
MTYPKLQVLLLGVIDHAHEEWKRLSEIANIIEPSATNREDFIKEVDSGRLDGIVAAYRTVGSHKVTGLIDDALVQRLPSSLKYICHNGAGYDQIDIAACTNRGIRVSHVPTAVDDATADTNMFLILGAIRGFNTGMLALREGKWKGQPLPPLGHDPEGKTLGILGMGGIGRNLKKKAEVFGMRVQYFNRHQLGSELAAGAAYVSFDELLRTSDVLSLNLPLNNETRHIISTAEFAKMKTGVVVVNTARGAVMDEEALVQALASGKVRSCGLDVYEDEPAVHPGLLANPHVMLVPHMGTWTKETQRAMEAWNIENVRWAVEKGRLKSPVVEQLDML